MIAHQLSLTPTLASFEEISSGELNAVQRNILEKMAKGWVLMADTAAPHDDDYASISRSRWVWTMPTPEDRYPSGYPGPTERVAVSYRDLHVLESEEYISALDSNVYRAYHTTLKGWDAAHERVLA